MLIIGTVTRGAEISMRKSLPEVAGCRWKRSCGVLLGRLLLGPKSLES